MASAPTVRSPEEHLGAALAGRYRIERELGRGGMATVYLARDLRDPAAVRFGRGRRVPLLRDAEVEGRSLRDRLTNVRPLPVDEAVRIAAEVAGYTVLYQSDTPEFLQSPTR